MWLLLLRMMVVMIVLVRRSSFHRQTQLHKCSDDVVSRSYRLETPNTSPPPS